MHLYKVIGHEFSSTFPDDGNPTIGAFNEGRRSVWVLIAQRLRESNEDVRRRWDEMERRRMSEENSQDE